MNRTVASTKIASKQGSRAFQTGRWGVFFAEEEILYKIVPFHISYSCNSHIAGMWFGMTPPAKKVEEGFSVNSQKSQFFISEAFQTARFNEEKNNVMFWQCNVIYCPMHCDKLFPKKFPSLRWKSSTTSSSGQKHHKRFSIFFPPKPTWRIDTPWLGTKVQGSSGKAPMTLGWADDDYDNTENVFSNKVISGVFGKTDRRLTLKRAKTSYPFGLHGWTADQVVN